MASDNAFAAALLGLWHRVAQAGGSVGFAASVDRAAIGALVAEVIAALRLGRAHGFAVTRKRDVIGFALSTPGVGVSAHTGEINLVMIDPSSQRAGLGTLLVSATLGSAAAAQLDRLRIQVPDDDGLQRFFARFGFVETGRSPGWIHAPGGPGQDELLMTMLRPTAKALGPTVEGLS